MVIYACQSLNSLDYIVLYLQMMSVDHNVTLIYLYTSILVHCPYIVKYICGQCIVYKSTFTIKGHHLHYRLCRYNQVNLTIDGHIFP